MNAPQNGPVPAPGAAGASSTNTIGIRRKRVLEDFEPHMLLNGGGERLLSDADQQLRGTYHSLPTDFFADVHNGFQTNHMMKSRRLGGDISHEDFHAAILGPLHRDVLAPLTGSGSPGPGLMSEPLQKANPFLPNSATIASFSTSQLDGFRLDGNVIEQKENKARVTKPFAKRSLHGTPMGTPKIQPPHLPMLSQFLSPTDPGRPGSTGPTAATLVSGSVPKQTPFTANDNSVFQGWRPSASQVAARQVGTGGSSLPSTPAMPTDTVEPVRNEVGFAFEVNPDQCSSDEEFSMENEISLSQDKLNSLSVHDISDHLLGADSTHKVPAPWLVMELDKAFASTLNEREERELKEIGVYTLTLGAEEEVILGRDHFFTVFGEKIRGAETFHLSRKHCVFHVSPCQSADSSKQLKIVVENTSTNGLDVNGQALKNKERKELHVGDTITLLKIKDHRGNIPLAYKLLEKRDVPLQGNGSTKIWESSSRKSPRVVRSRGSSKANSTRQPKSVRSLESSSSKSLPPKKKLKFPKLHVEILIADPFVSATDNSEEQSRGYRDELAAVLAAFSSVRRLRSNYECATKDALFGALKNPGKVVIYAGGSESNRLLIEDNTGMPTFISVSELAQAFGNEAIKAPLVVVFATSVSTAQLFVDSGFQHVIFLNSSSASRPKAARYLKALLAGFLQGSSVEDAHVVARRTALGLSSMAPTPSECLCGILPGGRSHNIAVGDFRSKPDSSRMPEMNLATLNALLIPSLPTYFIPREEVVGEVITALRKENAQVCILRGGMGVGKSSTAVYVAKYATDRRWYKGGVYYFSVVSAFANVDNDTAALGWTEDSFDSNEKRNEISGRIQQDIDELLQLLHPKNTSDAGQAILVVLDGCDRLNLVEFRDFLVKMVRAYPGVQFVLTMTQVMKINCYNKVVEECTVHLKELAPGDAANVFLSMAKFFLTSKRLEEALPSDSAEELAQHPALCRLDGNPSLISRLVLGLRTSNLDEFE